MPKLDFQINKPGTVDEENLTQVIDSIYDTINRLAEATNKFISKSSPAREPATSSDKLQIVDDQNTNDVKLSVSINGEWYSTTGLEKED